ncbi:hypothetical protein BVX98_03785 [bacterium F11]|nr:hypothetical protein BVX98_03785 [bacterium F11]
MSAISIQNIYFSYPPSRRKSQPVQALTNVSFSVEEGIIFGLLGPNGGGKTTLFRILSTLLNPTTGTARIFGFDVRTQSNQVRNRMGVVFQNPSLDKKLTLNENMVHQGRLYGFLEKNLRLKIKNTLQQMGLTDRQDEYVEHLSGGLQRRGEIGKSLLHSPKLLLMDEPSAGLDPGARRDLWHTLGHLKQFGVTVLLTTHLMEEADKCDRLGILHEGQLRALGSPSELKEKIGGEVISLQTEDPSLLAEKIKTKFGDKGVVLEGTVRLELENGHKIIPQLIEAFPGLIQAATVGKPTLEDVFIHETGHQFWMN